MRWSAWGAGAFLAVALLIGLYAWRDGQASSPSSGNGFDLSAVSERPAGAAPSAPPAPLPNSPAPLIGDNPEQAAPPPAPVVQRTQVPPAGGPGAANGAPASSALARAPEREREREFLTRHGKELADYHGRLASIALRHRRASKVVREVDEAFGRMDRYMEVKRRFDRSGDPFAFARDAIALPEVRAEISRRMKDPEVWKESVAMCAETLKSAPPPKALYDEALSFLGREPSVSEYIGEFSQQAAAMTPAIAAALPTDPFEAAGLQKVVSDAMSATARR